MLGKSLICKAGCKPSALAGQAPWCKPQPNGDSLVEPWLVISVFTSSIAIFQANPGKGHTHFCLLRDKFQNTKLMSLFSSFHTSQFLSLSGTFPPPPKAPWNFVHQYFPCAFRKWPRERGGVGPMASVLLLNTCPFRPNIQSVFSLS